MNKTSRRKLRSEFKSKVCLEALKERQAIEALARKYDLHANQISTWKKGWQDPRNVFADIRFGKGLKKYIKSRRLKNFRAKRSDRPRSCSKFLIYPRRSDKWWYH